MYLTYSNKWQANVDWSKTIEVQLVVDLCERICYSKQNTADGT